MSLFLFPRRRRRHDTHATAGCSANPGAHSRQSDRQTHARGGTLSSSGSRAVGGLEGRGEGSRGEEIPGSWSGRMSKIQNQTDPGLPNTQNRPKRVPEGQHAAGSGCSVVGRGADSQFDAYINNAPAATQGSLSGSLGATGGTWDGACWLPLAAVRAPDWSHSALSHGGPWQQWAGVPVQLSRRYDQVTPDTGIVLSMRHGRENALCFSISDSAVRNRLAVFAADLGGSGLGKLHVSFRA